MTSQDFARAVLEAFERAGRATDMDVVNAGGPSTTTMTSLRKAAAGKIFLKPPRNDTFRRIDDAANWKPGTARRVWRDGHVPPGNTAALRTVNDANRGIAVGEVEAYILNLQDRLAALEARMNAIEAQRARAQHEDVPDSLLGNSAAIEIWLEGDIDAAVAQRMAAQMSEDTSNVPDAIAAHEEEVSIAGEQEESDTP